MPTVILVPVLLAGAYIPAPKEGTTTVRRNIRALASIVMLILSKYYTPPSPVSSTPDRAHTNAWNDT